MCSRSGIDAELVERAAEEQLVGRETGEIELAGRHHDDAVGRRREVVLLRAAVFEIGGDRLAGRLEIARARARTSCSCAQSAPAVCGVMTSVLTRVSRLALRIASIVCAQRRRLRRTNWLKTSTRSISLNGALERRGTASHSPARSAAAPPPGRQQQQTPAERDADRAAKIRTRTIDNAAAGQTMSETSRRV